MEKPNKQVRLKDENHRLLSSLAKSNRLNLTITTLANIAVELSMPQLVKLYGSPKTKN